MDRGKELRGAEPWKETRDLKRVLAEKVFVVVLSKSALQKIVSMRGSPQSAEGEIEDESSLWNNKEQQNSTSAAQRLPQQSTADN